jgi:Dihydroorotase and related cyclic amidohydrolases
VANYWIKDATLVNEGKSFKASVFISEGIIKRIVLQDETFHLNQIPNLKIIDAKGKYLLPGAIDDQVHFREPGMTHKAEIYTESRAAVAGGVTSFMDMPNTIPQALTQDILQQKYDMAAEKSLANYSFYIGASNQNIDEVAKTDPEMVCGIKVFMGSSTGNMLVDDDETLINIFRNSPCLVAVHCEDESTIKSNMAKFKEEYGADAPTFIHPMIRNTEACLKSSSKAINLAEKSNTRLHLLHLTTQAEMALLRNDIPLEEKRITAEVCFHHLWFCDRDYERLNNFIKCNPAIKTEMDRNALMESLLNDKLDVVATDHAPHTFEEKCASYFSAPSGMPMVQHSLCGMLEFCTKGMMKIEQVVEKMAHNPAIAFQIHNRGFIREGYFADLVIVDPLQEQMISNDKVYYKCAWTPLNGETLHHTVTHTFVNGHLVFEKGRFDESNKGKRLTFDRK